MTNRKFEMYQYRHIVTRMREGNSDQEIAWSAAARVPRLIGAATLDRLRHGADKRVLDGGSYRALPPASEASTPPTDKGRKAASL